MRALSCMLLLLTTAAAARAEEEAVEVYRTVHPSVVSLSNIEGNGTGVILDETGLILTNAHVVASPLPFKCTVDIARGDRIEKTVTFQRVRIVGMHPEKDLALVRIDPKEHKVRLSPVTMARDKAMPGQRVYAIGNPSAGGQVLNKTITSGLLSGVDREVEGVRYYQVDAAINPGNSGGPLVNKAGEVLGIVTLKFMDVENVGFAIPVHDLAAKEFVPASQRKADPRKARESLVMAEKLAEKAEQLRKVRGAKDEEVILLQAYAAYCFHTALAHDPANPAIYYNCGMLLRSIDRDEIAAAYLLQAIQLDPWHQTDDRSYRELGLALVKQERAAEAKLAWLEGIAKYPNASAKCREDIAIRWHEERNSYGAALQAATILHLKDPLSRMEVANSIHAENSSRLDQDQRRRFDREVADLQRTLLTSQRDADKAKSAKKLYLTSDFAEYVRNNGVLSDADEGPIEIATAPRRDSSSTNVSAAADSTGDDSADDGPNEDAAASTLRIAEKWAGQGKKELADKWYQRVVEKYPDTDAARDARRVLGLPQPAAAVSSSSYRFWSDATGQFRVEAKLQGMVPGQVRLETRDGRLINVPVAKLSEFDQAWLKQQAAAAP